MTMRNLLALLMRNERAIIALILAIYGVGFVSFYPETVTNKDEILYIRQARIYAAGQTTVEKEYPLSGEMTSVKPVTLKKPEGARSVAAPVALLIL